MPISQYTQPAEGYYQPSYVAPPIQQIGQLAQQMAQEQEAGRQQAQQFVSGLAGGAPSADTAPTDEEATAGVTGQALGVGGRDVAIVRREADRVRSAIDKLSEEEGFNFRSPTFKTKFRNLRSEVLSNPYWRTARENYQQAQELEERLEENLTNLPSWRIRQAQEQLGSYRQQGSIDEQGRPIRYRFSMLPEETPDISERIYENLDRFRDETTGRFKSGVRLEDVARAAGLNITEDEEGRQQYEVGRIPAFMEGTPEGRELKEQARYLAERQAAQEGRKPTMEDVEEITRNLYKDMAGTITNQVAGETIDWSGISAHQGRLASQARQAQEFSALTENAVRFFRDKWMGTGPTGEKIANLNPQAALRALGLGDDAIMNIGDYADTGVGESEDSILVTELAVTNPEELTTIAEYQEMKGIRDSFLNTFGEKGAHVEDMISEAKRGFPAGAFLGPIGGPASEKEVEGISDKFGFLPRLSARYRKLTGKDLTNETKVIGGRTYNFIDALASNDVSDTQKKTFIRDIKSDIRNNLKEWEQSLPEGAKTKAEKQKVMQDLGKALKNARGVGRFEPLPSENKINTREGKIYIAGRIDMSKDDAERMIEESDTRTKLKHLIDDKVVTKYTVDEDNERVKIPVYIRSLEDEGTLINVFEAQQEPYRSGEYSQEQISRIAGTLADVKAGLWDKMFETSPNQEDIIGTQ